jgi:enoyl-CoA hydratase/carnithine racemase
VPVAQLETSVASVTTKWLSLPSMSLRNIKQLLRAAPTQDMHAHLTQELEGFVRASQQPEFVQRVQKFFAGS